MALANPSTAPRIVPYGEARLASDRMDNGRLAYRVSQTFANPSGYGGAKHGALDLANYECGDKLLASVAGRVRNWRDSWGALIVEIVESSGALVGYGHLSAFKQANGAMVARGALIGLNGNTGYSSGCHCHYYRRNSSGVLVDPWPLLEQNARKEARINGNGIKIRKGPGEPGGPLAAEWGYTKGGHIYRKSDNKDFGSLTKWRLAKNPVLGATHGIGSHPKSWARLWIAGAYRFIALPLVTYR